jgi:hypothetical protein
MTDAILVFLLADATLFGIFAFRRMRQPFHKATRMRTALKTYSRMDPFARAERRPR